MRSVVGVVRRGSGPVVVRLGFLANITHEPALVGLEKGFFAKQLGKDVTLKTTVFSTRHRGDHRAARGPARRGLRGAQPGHQRLAEVQRHRHQDRFRGGLRRRVAGRQEGITSAAQLKGKSLATPSLGNTQDVALRYWLKQHGLTTTPTGGGDVAIKPIKPNSAAVLQFKSGQLDGGWEPEPYATEMVLDGGPRLVNEASLWPSGKFVTTKLVVTQSFLKAHPSTVNGLLKGQIQASDYINANGPAAAQAANAELTKLLGKGLPSDVLTQSLTNLHFTNDPIAPSLATDAQHAVTVGLLKPVNLNGIYDLGPLNKLLKAADSHR